MYVFVYIDQTAHNVSPLDQTASSDKSEPRKSPYTSKQGSKASSSTLITPQSTAPDHYSNEGKTPSKTSEVIKPVKSSSPALSSAKKSVSPKTADKLTPDKASKQSTPQSKNKSLRPQSHDSKAPSVCEHTPAIQHYTPKSAVEQTPELKYTARYMRKETDSIHAYPESAHDKEVDNSRAESPASIARAPSVKLTDESDDVVSSRAESPASIARAPSVKLGYSPAVAGSRVDIRRSDSVTFERSDHETEAKDGVKGNATCSDLYVVEMHQQLAAFSLYVQTDLKCPHIIFVRLYSTVI